MRAALAQILAQQRQQDQSRLLAAGQQPIPGFTGPAQPGVEIPGMPIGMPARPPVGMAPPQQQLPPPQQQPFMASGPYGQQAMQMAGLLGPPQTGKQPTMPPGGGLLDPRQPGVPRGGFRFPRVVK